jgi:hypothetical protein
MGDFYMKLVEDSELSQLGRIYDDVLTSAEINIRHRPCISSFDNLNRRVSFLVIPTLEDLKYTMFEQTDPAQEVGYPLKVTSKEDIESAAFLAQSPPGILAHYDMIPTLVSRITKIVTGHIHSFTKEAIALGGTTRIIDADGLTPISHDHLFKKYYPV